MVETEQGVDSQDNVRDVDPFVKEGAPALRGVAEFVQFFKPIVPCILGLMCARTGLIVGTYGSYARTDENLFTDGSMLVTLAIMLIGWAFIVRAKSYVGKRRVNALFHVAIVGEALSLVV